MKREVWSVLGLAAASLVLGACADDGTTGGLVSGATVHVTLNEWTITPDRTTAPAGSMTVIADNKGADVHDLVLIETDIAPGSLPVTTAGDVDLKGAGVLVISTVADVAPGATGQFRLDDSTPGAYVFVSTVATSNGKTVGHPYAKGMFHAFTITEAPGQE